MAQIVVVDGYFSKEPFVSQLTSCGLDVISRFRDDVRLRYIIQVKKTGKRGRTKTNGETVDFANMDMKHFRIKKENEDMRIYSAVVHAVALNKIVRIAYVQFLKDAKVASTKVYFSTNIEMEATEVIEMYEMRFQIEFIYRDAKQHTNLTTCQARNNEKLHSHFNFSLTAVNIAKVVHWYSIPKEERKSFSIADIKTINHNTILLERFITMFAIKANVLKKTRMSKSNYITALLPPNDKYIFTNY